LLPLLPLLPLLLLLLLTTPGQNATMSTPASFSFSGNCCNSHTQSLHCPGCRTKTHQLLSCMHIPELTIQQS
jgi:hypothetical protein